MMESERRSDTSARVKRDVAVIGGGPAGSAAALVLARRGRDVVLFERSRGASPKLCGEFLSARGVRALERIGAIDAVRNAGAIDVSSWSVASARHEFRRRFVRPGLAVSRSALDPTLRALSQSQGAAVMEGARVASVEWRARSAAQLTIAEGVPGEVCARGLIAACGRVARIPGVADPSPHDDLVAMKAHVRDASPEGDARVALYALGDGYAGVVPTERGALNVCFLARRSAFRRSGSADAFLHDAASKSGPWKERWNAMDAGDAKWIAVSTMSFASRRPALGRAIAAGDASASVAPLLGEGMAFALESGELAGEAWHRALGGAPEERVRADYVRAWNDLARRRLALGRLLQAMLLESRGAALGVRCLEIAPGLGDWISGTSP